MKGLWLIPGLILAQDAQGTDGQQEPAAEVAPSLDPGEPGARAPRFDRELELEEIFAATQQLTEEFPGMATLEKLGHSRLGHELQVLALTDSSNGAADGKPGLLFVDYRPPPGGRGGVSGAEAVLAFGWNLARRAGTEPEIAELLAEHVVYLMPAADPDVRVVDDQATAPSIEFERNFPLGWLPDSLRPGSGDFPLARHETHALASFLRAHPNLVLIVGVTPARGRAELWPGAEFPAADREALDALCEPFASSAPELLPWGQLGSEGGGPFDYAYQALGIYPVAWVADSEEDVELVATRTVELLRRMPRMRIEPAGHREIAPGLWEVDVAISNAGVLPTLSALGARRRAAGELFLSVAGPRLLATARKVGRDLPFHSARLHTTGAPIDLQESILEGGETRWLRLVVEGEAGSVVALEGVGALAGSMRLEVALR